MSEDSSNKERRQKRTQRRTARSDDGFSIKNKQFS